jgi:hypothetical protein
MPGARPSARLRRHDEHGNLMRTVVSFLFAVSGGLAVIFLFFAVMGAIDFGDALAATIVAIVLALVWFGGFYYRHTSDAGRAQWRDRERRGF